MWKTDVVDSWIGQLIVMHIFYGFLLFFKHIYKITNCFERKERKNEGNIELLYNMLDEVDKY